MDWLVRGIGALLCLTGILAVTFAGIAAFLLCCSILSGEVFYPVWLLMVLIIGPLGLGLIRLGNVMCRD